MFTENEVAAIAALPGITEKNQELKKDFVKEEAKYLELSDHDFLSLVMMAPSVGIAKANGSVSFFEEQALNKKARKLSKGGYWMKKDPVVVGMKYLIRNYERWEEPFFEFIREIMSKTFDMEDLKRLQVDESATDEQFVLEGLKTPFVFIRFLTSFFMNDEEEDLVAERKLSQTDFDRVVEIGEKLGFSEVPVFRKFLTKFVIR